eukprot:6757047-Prorocentrum_lima.AAC.1
MEILMGTILGRGYDLTEGREDTEDWIRKNQEEVDKKIRGWRKQQEEEPEIEQDIFQRERKDQQEQTCTE